MDYSELSDFEINVLVAESLGWWVVKKFEENIGFTEGFHKSYPNTIWADTNKGNCTEQFSFTSDWADAGQLMEDNEIGLDNNPKRDGSMAFDYENVDNFSINKNPKRAIAECFLMMKADK